MLKTFFEQDTDIHGTVTDNKRYFDGMKIKDAREQYTSHMGKYPQIFLSLKSAKQPDYRLRSNREAGQDRIGKVS